MEMLFFDDLEDEIDDLDDEVDGLGSELDAEPLFLGMHRALSFLIIVGVVGSQVLFWGHTTLSTHDEWSGGCLSGGPSGLYGPGVAIVVPGECALHPEGRTRVEVRPSDSGQKLFVAIGDADVVDDYLAGSMHTVLGDDASSASDLDVDPASVGRPGDAGIWKDTDAGTGALSVERTQPIDTSAPDVAVVIMNDDGSPGVGADVSVRASWSWQEAGIALVVMALLVGVSAMALLSGMNWLWTRFAARPPMPIEDAKSWS
jgi:hypothetical protein